VISFTLRPLYSRRKSSKTHWRGDRMGAHPAGLDAVEKRKINVPAGNPNPAVKPVAHHYTD
jgi:hypothetical protein